MRLLVILLVVISASVCVVANNTNNKRIIKENNNNVISGGGAVVPSGWVVKGRPAAEEETVITIAVKQKNLDQLEAKFWEVSDPQHANYGKHLTHDEVRRLVEPTRESLNTVKSWLRAHNVNDDDVVVTRGGDFIRVKATVKQVEELLDVPLLSYEHSASGTSIIRVAKHYTVPEYVAPHLDFVGGILHFPKIKSHIKPHVAAPQAETITPAVAKAFLKVDSSVLGTSPNNSQAVAQFLNQYYSPRDLAAFQKRNQLDDQVVTKVVGPNNPNRPGLEATLDIEYIMGIASHVPTWFVYTDGLYQTQEPFLEWIVDMAADPTSPYVHSVSYGDEESSVSPDYVQRIDVEFQKFGVTGRSILFASGDNGVGCSPKCDRFAPNWPASSPYVTSVGGMYVQGSSAIADTIASGGFSNTFKQPSYQQAAVAAYLKSHTTPSPTFYNSSGRAMPDIAAFSESVQIVYETLPLPIGGTSCAAPIVSGVIALLNDARLNAKKAPLGFLNPFLYQTLANHPDAFTDITTGDNSNGCCKGFQAAVGWDPITGVGVPNFPALRTYALAAAK